MIFAVFADENGRKGVNQGFAVARSDAYIEVLRDGGKLFFRRSGEVPVEEFFLGVLAGVGAAVAAKHLRRVVGRVEADAEKMGLLVECGVGGQSLIDFGEVAAHARAEVGERAAGVDEGKEEDLALELRRDGWCGRSG